MTPTFQSSRFNSELTSNYRTSGINHNSIYQVEITDFDGDIHVFEVCADSFSEAADIAESLALCDINFMNIYEF